MRAVLTGEEGLRSWVMKSTSLWAVLDEAVALTRLFVLKWNSLGTVADRTIFFGGTSETTVTMTLLQVVKATGIQTC